jgi:hypothetical protein
VNLMATSGTEAVRERSHIALTKENRVKFHPLKHVAGAFAVSAALLFAVSTVSRAAEVPAAPLVPDPPIRSAEFPTVAARVQSFEQRVNAADPKLRRIVVMEAFGRFPVAKPDAIAFFRRMLQDPDPLPRGTAVRKLYELWVPVEVKELPQVFVGYSERETIDLEDANLEQSLIAQCQKGGAPGGWAAYALGLLRRREAKPTLIYLGNDKNVFARYTAGRALIDMGERAEGLAILRAVIEPAFQPIPQGETRASYRTGGTDPYYTAMAARTLVGLGGAERVEGLRRLIGLLGELETSKDINDANRLETARVLLQDVTGAYFNSAREAQAWLQAHPQD